MQIPSIRKHIHHGLFISLLALSITACDKEEATVTLSLPDTPALASPDDDNADGDGTIALEIPNQTPVVDGDTATTEASTVENSQADAPEYPFKKLALESQLSQKFGRNVVASNQFIPDGFYPLGWSKDGNKFAYASQYITNGSAEGSTFNVYIQDLVTDEIIWKTSSKTSAKSTQKTNQWEQQKEAVLAALNKYKIAINSDFPLHSPPIVLKKDTLSYKIKVQKSKKYASLKGYEVFLKSSRKGIKKVANEHFKKRSFDEVGSKRQAHILGYLQGKNPNRIALLVGILELGWEGKKIVRYKVVGASLTAGKWKK